MLVNRSALATLTNNSAYNSIVTYPDSYLNGVLAAVQAEIGTHLKWQPWLQVIQNEEGLVRYVTDGVYAGRYYMELKHQPLIPGPAATIFQNLQLTYALAYSGPTNVGLSLVQVTHPTGLGFALGPGQVEALVGITFSFAAPKPAVYATGYVASYVAGYATGFGDPIPSGGGAGFSATATVVAGQITAVTVTNAGAGYSSPPMLIVTDSTGNGALLQAVLNASGGVGGVSVQAPGQGYSSNPTIAVSNAASFNALPLPADIQQAALLLIRERIAFEDAMNASPVLATGAGVPASVKTARQAIAFLPPRANLPPTDLGYGGFLAQTAAGKLRRYVKRRLPDFV